MGDYGKIDASEYAHKKMTARRVEALERDVAAWLASARPGSFTSKDAVGLYERARARFEAWSGRSETRDDFEIALARLGYRAGTVVYDGAPFWILALPSSVNTALDRLAAMEN